MQFEQRLVQQLHDLPGIDAAGATSDLPIQSGPSGTAFDLDGRPLEPGQLPPIIYYSIVTPGYFAAMRTPITSGRDFVWTDTREGVNQVLVNQTMAKQYWPNENPIGKRVKRAGGGDKVKDVRPWFTVMGVVADVRQSGPREPINPMIYFAPNAPGIDEFRSLTYVIRGPQAATQAEAIRHTVRGP